MPSSGMLRRVALVRTDVSVERIASIIKVTRIRALGTLVVISNRMLVFVTTFLRNGGSYKSRTSSHSNRWYSSYQTEVGRKQRT
jgi:hypothetical protein